MRVLAAVLPALALVAAMPARAADPEPGVDPLTWLQRAAAAARETTYAGTIVHMQGARTSTSRITHVNISGSEHERIESLDGPRREIVRRDDQLQCYFPDAKTVRYDRRVSGRFFPSLVAGPVDALPSSYRLSLGQVERMGGQECQWVLLEPKDALRYAQRLCAELGTGLLLRAQTLGAKGQVLEQYAFADLRVGRDVSRGEVKSTFVAQSKSWRRDVQAPPVPARPGSAGWTVGAPPPGFRLVGEMLRTLPHRPAPVTQFVLSDGIAAMSVFVEAATGPKRTAEAVNRDGALSVFVRPVGDHVVTVLGEVPPAAAQQAGRSVAKSAEAAR